MRIPKAPRLEADEAGEPAATDLVAGGAEDSVKYADGRAV